MNIVKTVSDYMKSIGAKGGRAGTGEAKLRGGKAYYERISAKAQKARRKKQRERAAQR